MAACSASGPTDSNFSHNGGSTATTVRAADLSGLAAADVTRLLGRPGLRRVDPPAELWQYKRSSCVLDIVLYVPEKGGFPTVDHLEARSLDGQIMDVDHCLRAPRPSA
ncbi:MAG: hypothetical protein ACPGNT_07310 [Rhodospirillales bacterium]